MRIEEANAEMDLMLPESDDYETIAGFILYLLGHIPEVNERIEYKSLRLVVTNMRGIKIGEVQATKESDALSGD